MMRRGISTVVTTVLLTGIMITILGVTLFMSNTMIEYYTQATEYKNAQNLMTYLADAVEQVALGSGGAKYVRFSLRTSRLDFVRNFLGSTIEVYVNTQLVIRDYVDALVLRGGNLLTAPAEDILYPEGVANVTQELGRYIVRAGEPVTLVYESNMGGPATVLICRRVRVNYIGVYSVVQGCTVRYYNVFEIDYINLTIGSVGGGSGTLPVIVRNVNVTLSNYYIPANAFTLSIYVGGALKQKQTFSGDPLAQGTLVVVRVSTVEVNSLG